MPKASNKSFKRGDHVSWNSEAGRVRGHVLRVHTEDVDYKGHVHHATQTIRNTRSEATRPITSPCIRERPCGGSGAECHKVS